MDKDKIEYQMIRMHNRKLFLKAKTKAAYERISLIELVEKAIHDYLSKKTV
jgi:hypothetical protein